MKNVENTHLYDIMNNYEIQWIKIKGFIVNSARAISIYLLRVDTIPPQMYHPIHAHVATPALVEKVRQ